MFLILKVIKRKLENTFFDNFFRIFINKISFVYYKLLSSKRQCNEENLKFIFINYGGMGDCILTLPLINNLSKKYNLIVLLEKKLSQLEHLTSSNVELIYYDKEQIFSTLKNVAEKNKNYILIQQSPIFEFLVFHFILKRPPVIGYIFSQEQLSYLGMAEYHKPIKNLNKLLKYEEITSSIDKIFQCSNKTKYKSIKKENDLFSDFKLLENSYFILSPTKNPRWEMGFLEFIEYRNILIKISKKSPLIPVVVGVKDDIDIIKKIIEYLPKEFNFVNLVGKTNILQLIELIKNSNFVLANDNGIQHLANFLDKKTLTLFNFSSPNVYKWHNENSKYIFNPEFDCMPCIGKNKGPFDNYPFKCPWNVRCKKTINSSMVIKELTNLNWIN